LSISSVFKQFQQRWLAKEGRPTLVECAGQKYLIAFPAEEKKFLPSATEGFSNFLDDCFATTLEAVAEIGEQARFRQIVKSQIARLKKRQKNITLQQHQGENFTERRHLGELLIANLHLIKKGMTEVTLTDWGIDPPAQVKLDLQPDLSPQQNAERLFKRYKKEKRGVEHIDRRQQETADELDWLESLLLSLDEAHEAGDILELGQELQKAGLVAVNKNEPASRGKLNSEPRLNQALSPGGLRIFWGRNNRSNDHLSARLTDRDDLWFHACNMPGCHLVLKRDGLKGDFPAADIEYAAQIAAGYSRGQHESRVLVIVTEGRHVSRPKGAKPGLVRVAEHRTLRVAPMRVTAAGKPPKD
jgi:predicted ribosome quality control (RQC) complex YloA/Tae2 family protein